MECGYKNSLRAQAQDVEGLLSICVEVPRESFHAKESKYTNRAISRRDSVLSETLPGRHFAAIESSKSEFWSENVSVARG